MKARMTGMAWLLCLACVAPLAASPALFEDTEALLPPLEPWSGASEGLVAGGDDPWVTPAEQAALRATPGYEDTVRWLRRLVDASPDLDMVSVGRSLRGRDIWMVIASADGVFTPEALAASGKPLLIAHAGIHAGEIDGKDAGLMLLRDMTVAGKRRELLDGANLLFIPILNVDGHERVSPYNRVNQRGPERMGWRTNARNQNLNRDFTKLDTPGVRALVEVFNEWKPDLYLDLHVTDGADYQYDITFGGNGRNGWSPAIGTWIEDRYRPAMIAALDGQGHVPGPLIFAANGKDMRDGVLTWSGEPRYSNGYGDAAHLPSVLVENHSLKPYRRRVLGTYVLLAATLEFLATDKDALREAARADRERRPSSVPMGFDKTVETPPARVPFRGIRSERYQGSVSGAEVVRWTGQAVTEQIPEIRVDTPVDVVERPLAYVIPPEWAGVAERISWHGIEIEKLESPLTVEAEVYRLPGAAIAQPSGWTPNPFEGHVRIDAGEPVPERIETTFPAGSFKISTDQDLGELLMLMLEPRSADSFLQWGFFLEIFTRTEYAESYVMEPLARRMLDADPRLRERFEQKLAADESFAADPRQRLMWFYEQTPFHDSQYRLYPVARIPRP